MRTRTTQKTLLTRAATKTLLLAVLMLAAVPQRAGAQTPATIGGIEYNSVGGYYEINEPDDLRDLATYVNGTGTYRDDSTETTAHDCSGLKFKMTDDITFDHNTAWDDADCEQENNYVAIGCYYNYDHRYFRGDFDGAGHTISGIRIHRSGSTDADYYQGIFGLTNGANIHGLRLADARITGYNFTGGIVGLNFGTVTDCHVASNVCIHDVQPFAYHHGGIVGQNNGTVGNCTSTATLTIASDATWCMYYGAIAGYNEFGTLSDNLAIGATVPAASNNYHGAIVGYSYNGTLQRNYYTACKVASENVTPTGVGCYNADVTENDGAVPALLTLNGNTYTISNTGGWDVFCYLLADNEKGYFDSKTVKLANNITVTWMAGGSHHDFTGTFDGGGHTLTVAYGSAESPITAAKAAPFVNVESGCIIENLHVAGDIYTSGKNAAGIAGTQYGAVTIRNCRVSTAIHSLTAGDGTHGGIVGSNGNGEGSSVTIEGCLFDGKLLTEGTTATTNCSGFVGYRSNNRTVTITNSLYAPADLADGETEVEDGTGTISATFVRNGAAGSNCYYTRTLGTAQGKQALTHEAVSAVGEPIATYNVSGISIYGNGMQYGSTFYYDPERNFLRTVEGHNNEDGGWVFIASPLAAESIAPSEVQNLLGSYDETTETYDYDLYRFNQSVGLEWQNYHSHTDDFNLVNGQGYLYANSEDVTLVFTGTPYEGDGVVSLAYETTNTNQNMWGWNLVGNPFVVPATVNMNYYKMNDDGTAIEPVDITQTPDPIAVGTGIMVQANGANQKVTFGNPTRTTDNHGGLRVALHSGAEVIDNAIVSFNEGSKLGKFYFGEQDANIYLPQGSEDYAIATSNGQGEMPLNFRAEENGTYTITVNPDNVELAYLHLIDNMTGADVDLLAVKVPELVEGPTINDGVSTGSTTSYTFTAKTTDYESRFKLVFSAIENADSDDDAPFAYVSNGNIIVNGEGTLQIVDVMGRVVVSVGGHTRCVPTSGMTAGVYVLRLINGDDVRTQKIVID